MKAHLIVLLLIVMASPALAQDPDPRATPQPDLVLGALQEFEISLDAYFELAEERSLSTFTEAVRHAARGRLMLEAYLGDDIDSWSAEFSMDDQKRSRLAIIAAYAERFTAENAVEMWRQDYAFESFPDARQELAEWDVLVKHARLETARR